jgi:hypothetical protein
MPFKMPIKPTLFSFTACNARPGITQSGSVAIATGYELDGRGSILGIDKSVFPTASGPSLLSSGYWGFSSEGKAAGP